MPKTSSPLLLLICFVFTGLALTATGSAALAAGTPADLEDSAPAAQAPAAKGLSGPVGEIPLPHYKLGKQRPYDPEAATRLPYAVSAPMTDGHAPGTGMVRPHAEYTSSRGLLLSYDGYWEFVSTELARAAADSVNDSMAYILVNNDNHQTTVSNTLTAAGVEMGQVEFIQYATNAIWIRDYGPHFILHDDTRGIVNSIYWPERPLDSAAPVAIAEEWDLPLYDTPVEYAGGNFLSTANRHGYVADIIINDNPAYNETEIASLFYEYQGVETLHIFPAFPFNIDGTGHIDMWMCILGDDKVIIGEYDEVTPGYEAYTVSENAVTYMESLGFTVYRTPGMNDGSGGYGGTHITYTNAVPLNDKIIVPVYGGVHAANDAAALATYQAALPGHTITPINCTSIIWAAGALHCIAMQVPAHIDPLPSVKVLSPNGGEVVASRFSADDTSTGYPRDIRWAAEDDTNIFNVDLYYSTDGGSTFPYTIAEGIEHDGLFEGWLPPRLDSGSCVIKVAAHDGDLNVVEDVSDSPFDTDRLMVSTYDFSHGAGTDKWVYGYFTDSWVEDLEGTRMPENCSTPVDEIQEDAYQRLAFADADGGDTDDNRYHQPSPGGGNEATMIAVFTIDEDPAQVRSLEFLYEGYANRAIHMEIYVWDDVAGNWCNGAGAVGVNNFMDNGSNENGDRILTGMITDDPSRYITVDGEVTFLFYCDQRNDPSFHDYLRLKVFSDAVVATVPGPRQYLIEP